MEWMLLPIRRLYRLIEGRSSRREFWMFFLLNVIILVGFVGVVVATVGLASFNPDQWTGMAMGAGVGMMLILIIPLYIWFLLAGVASVAVTIRRFHDLNLSGWLYLLALALNFIPFVNFLVWIAVLVLMCLKGTDGPNKYGEDPTQPDNAAVFR
jgi:uncharacterized membrane protein YhaH (DUF805 family)